MAQDEWIKYQELVLSKLEKHLEKHEELLDRLSEQITEIKIEIGKLQVKSGIWGGIAGAAPFLIWWIAQMIKGK